MVNRYVTATVIASGLTVEMLLGDAHDREVCNWREAAWWLQRRLTGNSTSQIARDWNRVSHSTALRGIKRMSRAIERDDAVAIERIQKIEQALRGPAAA